MQKLNWRNYQELQKKMDQIDHPLKFSAMTLMSWVFYGIQIEFEFTTYNNEPIILFMARFNRFFDESIEGVQNQKIASMLKYGDHFILCPIFDVHKHDCLEVIAFAFDQLEQHYPILREQLLDAVPSCMLSQLNRSDYELIFEWNSNYIYYTQDLKLLAGKKLQKKRNHLNYFIKTYEKSVVVAKISDTDFNDIIAFCQMLLKYSDRSQKLYLENELVFLRNVLDNFDSQTMSGIVVRSRSKNQIIGFTIGYLHGDYYELIFEKADWHWRGLYQYLITQNLIINDIQTTYIDRQDDAGEWGLEQSKRSYQPIEIFQMAMIYFH